MVLFKGISHLAAISKARSDPHNILYPYIHNARTRIEARQSPTPHPYLDLLRARLAATPLDPSLRAVYDHTVEQLYKQFSAFYLAPDPDPDPADAPPPPTPDILDIFIWVSAVSDDFMPLLRSTPSQETLAIFSYFCMLPKRLPRRWWLNRWADSLKIRTYELLDTEHRTWVVEPTTWSEAAASAVPSS